MNHTLALERTKRSLDGLSVGDAFGEKFFGEPGVVWSRVVAKAEPEPPWPWTDDTAMARVVVQVLESHRQVSANHLADAFAREYRRDPSRGYGTGAAQVLSEIAAGVPWQTASSLLFRGSGSYGNGAAMRSAPIGAYYAEDADTIVEQATIASEVTHFHPDGVAGGVAVALAAAWMASPRDCTIFDFVLEYTPPGGVRRAIQRAAEFSR